jgi:epoxyqueuosine reductase
VDLARLDELDGIRVGVAPAAAYTECEATIAERRARGLFGDLRFTLTNTARSCHPERLVRGARTVIAVAMPLWRPAAPRPAGLVGRLPRYAWHDPYAPLRTRLEALTARLRRDHGARATLFVDSNHHVDREAAIRAGLAFSAKNTMAIVPGQGSFVALGAVVTDLELEPAEQLVPPGCGSCTRCLDACPTGALIEPGVLDARACISNSTQRAAAVPDAHADALEDRVYGCDICQDVCPWNVGPAARRADLEPDPDAWVPLQEWLALPEDDLLERHGHLYVPQRDVRYLRRNALIALGNAGGDEARALAEPFARSGDPVLAPPALRVLERS